MDESRVGWFHTSGERIAMTWAAAFVAIVFLFMNPLTVGPHWAHPIFLGKKPGKNQIGPCDFPRAVTPECAGLPSGISVASLTELPCEIDGEAHAITETGARLDRVYVPCHLLIRAENVVVTNSYIEGNVMNDYNDYFWSYTISDTTLTSNEITADSPTGCITAPGLASSRYTATRVEIRNHDDGFHVTTPGGVTVQDSFVKLCWNDEVYAPPDGSHAGGIQFLCETSYAAFPDDTCYSTTFTHNTIDNSSVDSGGDPVGNSSFTAQSCTAPGTGCGVGTNPISGINVRQNLLMGGGYVMWPWWGTGPNYEIHNNRIVDDSWAFNPIDSNGTCANQNWSGNTIVTLAGNTFDQTNLPTTEYSGNYDITSTVRTVNCDNS